MLDLFLIRHAKSELINHSGEDLNRDLSDLGIEKTKIIGEHIFEQKFTIEEILCSPALRTKKTLEIILDFLVKPPKIRVIDDLYYASGKTIYETVVKEAKKKSTMVISHDPLLSQSIEDFSSDNRDKNYINAREKFPTSSLFYIKFKVKKWSEISKINSRIISFTRPKDLMD